MAATDDVPLIDQHCHAVLARDPEPAEFAGGLTEAAAAGTRDRWHSSLGLAVRRWCAPLLDLPAHAAPEDYLERRAELGWRETTDRLLRATGVEHWFVDTGYAPSPELSPGEVCGRGHEVVRVEQVAESTAGHGAHGLLDAFRAELRDRARDAVALKTVVAYRSGLDVPGECPSDRDATRAAGEWLRSGGSRLTDPVLHAWVVHEAARVAAELGLPLQFHTGFGDEDLHLREVDPLLLTDFLRTTRANVVLLHCWPFHRNAAYLAHVFDHVSVDIGLTLPFVGVRADDVLAEALELAPFDSVLYSSDGNVLPELHHLGAVLWRHHFGRLLDSWLADDVLDADAAERLAYAVGAGNAARLHQGVSPTPR
ncbi:amidohydrolase family protein [Actinophytocola gossypii]|uniref:Amidohydrolase family protein n=1 Tax=Actinophytocola gossypii TaxID=2812003 RepID=A0ABT2JJN0_9PSEU|nr:amidohydrolase family protein [Actinophytocola gossypii]MCT2588098.1 amidohydrolase family protein [Actinophytocola gossypii]